MRMGSDDVSSEYSEFNFKKLDKEHADKAWITQSNSAGPMIVIVDDMAQALPIITRQHKPWCPFCNSPKCMRENRVLAEAICFFPFKSGRWVGEYYFEAYRCKRFKHYFLFTYTTKELKSLISSTAIECSWCGSKKIIISERAIGRPKPMTKQDISVEHILRVIFVLRWERITQVELVHYRCINCKYSAVIARSTTRTGKILGEEVRAKDMQTAKKIMSENREYFFSFDDTTTKMKLNKHTTD